MLIIAFILGNPYTGTAAGAFGQANLASRGGAALGYGSPPPNSQITDPSPRGDGALSGTELPLLDCVILDRKKNEMFCNLMLVMS